MIMVTAQTPLPVRWSVRLVGALIAVAALSTCTEQGPGDEGPDRDVTEFPTGAQVSNPVELTSASGISVSILHAESQENLVYVSLPTGTVENGLKAAVRRAGDEVAVITTMQDGGFDPVAVRAGPTDAVEIVVTKLDGGLVSITTSVSPKRPPTVVRTWPPRKKSDMPLNATMVVVFSEPLDKNTVSSTSVKLYHGQMEVAGEVTVLDGDGTAIAFTPSANLEPGAEYRLVVSGSVTDLEGEPMGTDVVLGFSTGTTTLGPPTSIQVSPDSIVLIVGSTYQFSAKVFDANGNLLVRPVTWQTSTPDLVSVSSTGRVTALRTQDDFFAWPYGKIEARVGTLASSAVVTPLPAPASIEILPPSVTLGVGDTLALNVVTRSWSDSRILLPLTVVNSNPTAVAVSVPDLGAIQVSPFRTVKALAPGTAHVTVKAGGVSAATDIVVSDQRVAVDTVRVAPAAAEMMAQETLQLTAWLRDANGTNIYGTRAVSWSSSNTSVLTADGSGKVTAVANGTATITATSEGKTSSASITVSAQPVAPNFIQVAANAYRTCGVSIAGDAYCWGSFRELEQFKQLRVPTLLPGGLDLAALTPGWGSGLPGDVCGRTNPGDVFCWIDYTMTPNRFAQTLNFSDLSASDGGHACGVATNGSTYCWGGNLSGQIGNGTTQSRVGIPTAVVGGHAFKSVVVGRHHSCGVTVAGDAYCWGANTGGQYGQPPSGSPPVSRLGTGDSTTGVIPTPSLVAGSLVFAQLSAGLWHTCGITVGGEAYCWGYNHSGVLGDGTQSSRSVPVKVATALRFTAVAVGNLHNCAIATSGAAYCWGDNYYGQLGVDVAEDCPGNCSRQPVAVQGNLSFVRISVGSSHSCAIATTGRLYCWGGGGSLGDGTNLPRSVPTPVSRP